MHIVTASDEISVDGEWYSPIVHQNCMKPEEISIFPLKIYFGEQVTVQDRNHMVRFRAGGKEVQTRAWKPELKKRSCIPCRNCGRCSW